MAGAPRRVAARRFVQTADTHRRAEFERLQREFREARYECQRLEVEGGSTAELRMLIERLQWLRGRIRAWRTGRYP